MDFKSYTECQLATAVTRHVAPRRMERVGWAALIFVAWIFSLAATAMVAQRDQLPPIGRHERVENAPTPHDFAFAPRLEVE
jgi:hypothetical protein